MARGERDWKTMGFMLADMLGVDVYRQTSGGRGNRFRLAPGHVTLGKEAEGTLVDAEFTMYAQRSGKTGWLGVLKNIEYDLYLVIVIPRDAKAHPLMKLGSVGGQDLGHLHHMNMVLWAAELQGEIGAYTLETPEGAKKTTKEWVPCAASDYYQQTMASRQVRVSSAKAGGG